MTRFQTIKELADQTGYSEAAIRSKISRGDWPEEEVWVRAPDGRILIDVNGFESWVTCARAATDDGFEN